MIRSFSRVNILMRGVEDIQIPVSQKIIQPDTEKTKCPSGIQLCPCRLIIRLYFPGQNQPHGHARAQCQSSLPPTHRIPEFSEFSDLSSLYSRLFDKR